MAEVVDTRELTRREFTAASVMALLAGVAVTISGCGDDEGPTSPAAVDRTGVISDNHGHSAVVTAAQITAGGAVSLSIQGAADHNHVVELSMDEVRQVGAGTRVSKQSTTTIEHSHTVTFN